MPRGLPRSVLSPGLVAACLPGCALICVPVLSAWLTNDAMLGRIVVFATVTLAVLVLGLLLLGRAGMVQATPATRFRWPALWLIVALTVPWAMVIVDSPTAAYFLFAMFALAQWLLPPRTGVAVAVALTFFTVAGQVFHHGWSAGALIGPLVALVVVVVLLQAYRIVVVESAEKSRLMGELEAAQAQLAATEREAGQLAERTRLGRDLHDTVAQSLASIQLLLHAAERTTPEPGAQHLRQAREAAGSALAETRTFISDLAPPDLAGRELTTAVRRIAERARGRGLQVQVETAGHPAGLTMAIETTLLRIAQEALENVIRHASATHCDVRLVFEPGEVRLEVDDDGVGFDPELPVDDAFGVAGMRSRTAELGGYTAIVSAPGDGTLVVAAIPLEEDGP